ncbi:MAG: tetratricopeptide repeat protein, partial [Cyclobacteriaceae bacterium]|nr:tetratricopeptide repeat protein [Cyclobacteriaceae bacterium]
MVVLIFYLFVESSALTYHEPIDSLRKAVTTPVGVQEKAELYNALAWEYRDTHPDSALYFTKQALRLARENKLRRQEVQALNYMGVAYRNLSVYSKAFEMYLEALRLSEQYQDDEQRGYTLINLGNLYIFQTNFQGAIQYFVKALDQAQALGDRRMQAYCNINLARSYEGIGEYGRAEIYMRSVIDIREGLSDEYGLMGAEIELAEILRKTGNFRASQEITERILNDDKLKDYPRILILAYNTLSKIYLGQGKTQKAQQYAELALDLSREYASRYDEKEVLRNLSKIYASKDDFRPAFEYHINFSELNQLLFSEENIRKIEQLKNQYEAEKQEAENEFLRRQDELNRQVIERQQMIIGLSIVAVLLLVIVATLSYRAFLVRTRLSEEIKRQKDKIVQDRDTIEIQSAKLIELDAAKSRFFSNISHDLRSPLSLILGNLEMIQDDEASYLTPNSRKNLDIGLKNSKRLLYLTDEINDITRLEEGRLNLKLENIRVNTFLTLLTDMFKSTAEYKAVGLGFETSLPASQTFRVDARQFEKVFYNLISNAIR